MDERQLVHLYLNSVSENKKVECGREIKRKGNDHASWNMDERELVTCSVLLFFKQKGGRLRSDRFLSTSRVSKPHLVRKTTSVDEDKSSSTDY